VQEFNESGNLLWAFETINVCSEEQLTSISTWVKSSPQNLHCDAVLQVLSVAGGLVLNSRVKRLGTFKHILKIPGPFKNQLASLETQSTLRHSEHLKHERSYCCARLH